jgi:Tol biopolymer transport system component
MSPVAPGTKLGHYEILSPLGAGGMGEVFRARDARLGRDVAVKVIAFADASEPDRLRRFEQEARAVAAINHPSILSVFDVGATDQGLPYVVFELLEGETLRRRMAGQPLPLRKAADWAAQVARALGAAHERGIVHRDIKPENVFVTRDGHVKVLDFGLAKLVHGESAAGGTEEPTLSDLTEPGAIVGTAAYMSPEQVRGTQSDARSDIFSLGAVLYELVTGRRAFIAETAAETMSAILRLDPPPLSSDAGPVPPDLERVVRRCLEKRPEERFQSARDLAFALESLSSSGASLVGPRRLASVPWRRTLAGAALVALGAIAATLWLKGQPPARPEERVRFPVTLPPGASFDASPIGTHIAVAPDGRQVAFVAAAAGRLTRLWLRRLDELQARPLEGTENAVSPFWSPDGRFLAFFSEGRLRKVSAQGGSPETLCDTAFAVSGTWNTEGTILFSQFAGPNGGLWRVSASGGAPERVRTDAGDLESWPQFLPDGRHFLFLTGAIGLSAQAAQKALGEPALLHAGSLDSPVSKRLLPVDSRATYVAGGRLVFARSGSLMTVPFDVQQQKVQGEATPLGETVVYHRAAGSALFSTSPDGRALVFVPPPAPSQLTWFDRAGRPAGSVGEPAHIFGVRLSPDGRKAAAHVFDLRKGGRDIWVDDLARGVRSRLTSDSPDTMFPIWDPRGERIAYASARGGLPPQVYVRDAASSGVEQLLLDAPGIRFPRDWSADGRRIALEDFMSDRRARVQLWLLTPGPPASVAPFMHGTANKYDPQFSPDGGSLAYTSEETGRPEVFVAALDETSRRQVSSKGGSQPRWRRDGRELFYISQDGELVAVSLTPGRELSVGQSRPLFSPPVRSTGMMTGYGTQYDVSADGERFLFSVLSTQSEASFVWLLGWQGELRP